MHLSVKAKDLVSFLILSDTSKLSDPYERAVSSIRLLIWLKRNID